jgi:hypothetical protein
LRSELLHDKSQVRVTMIQLPALNTPQFEWVKSRLPGRAQPVPPIFQPEVAAEAIVWCAEHRRRELYVGFPTWRAVIGNRLAPAFGDWYLARRGYTSQQTEEPEDPARPHNLCEPVDATRDFGAHGRFDTRARSKSWALMASEHRSAVVLIGAGLLGAALALRTRRTTLPGL